MKNVKDTRETSELFYALLLPVQLTSWCGVWCFYVLLKKEFRIVITHTIPFSTYRHQKRKADERSRPAKKQTILLSLYSLEFSICRSLTLPDAVKWGIHCGQVEQVCCEASLLPYVRQSGWRNDPGLSGFMDEPGKAKVSVMSFTFYSTVTSFKISMRSALVTGFT